MTNTPPSTPFGFEASLVRGETRGDAPVLFVVLESLPRGDISDLGFIIGSVSNRFTCSAIAECGLRAG